MIEQGERERVRERERVKMIAQEEKKKIPRTMMTLLTVYSF